jgi:hypothetical protein
LRQLQSQMDQELFQPLTSARSRQRAQQAAAQPTTHQASGQDSRQAGTHCSNQHDQQEDSYAAGSAADKQGCNQGSGSVQQAVGSLEAGRASLAAAVHRPPSAAPNTATGAESPDPAADAADTFAASTPLSTAHGCIHSSSDAEAQQVPAGGIGYSKLRRLQTTATCSAAAAAGSGLRHLSSLAQPYVAAPAAGDGDSSGSHGSGVTAGQRAMPLQAPPTDVHLAGRGDDAWATSEDVVMSWYQCGDDSETEDMYSGSSNSTSKQQGADSAAQQHSAAAADATLSCGAGSGTMLNPASPGLWLQHSASSHQAGLLTAPGASGQQQQQQLLQTSSGGIEYSKMLRTRPGSPLESPRHTRFQQKQQQQQQGADLGRSGMSHGHIGMSHGHTGMSHGVSSQLVTGWYSTGLHSDNSSNSSSHHACWSHLHSHQHHHHQQQQQASGHPACQPPSVYGPVQVLLPNSSTGGAGRGLTIHHRADSSGGWSCEEGSETYSPDPFAPGVTAAAAAVPRVPLGVGSTVGTARVSAAQAGSSAGGLGPWQYSRTRTSSTGGAVQAGRMGSTGGSGHVGSAIGSFDLRPCFEGPPLSSRDASVSELLAASQTQIHCMETTLASMLQVAQRWTSGGADESPFSLRDRFSSGGH